MTKIETVNSSKAKRTKYEFSANLTTRALAYSANGKSSDDTDSDRSHFQGKIRLAINTIVYENKQLNVLLGKNMGFKIFFAETLHISVCEIMFGLKCPKNRKEKPWTLLDAATESMETYLYALYGQEGVIDAIKVRCITDAFAEMIPR